MFDHSIQEYGSVAQTQARFVVVALEVDKYYCVQIKANTIITRKAVEH